MSYLKSYLKALFNLLCFFGAINLVTAACFGNAFAQYGCFLALMAALAGPIEVVIVSKKTS